MSSVCFGSWNECCQLLCLAALGLLSRTVAAESMRHPRATGGMDAGFVRINPRAGADLVLSGPTAIRRTRGCPMLQRVPTPPSEAAARTSAQRNS